MSDEATVPEPGDRWTPAQRRAIRHVDGALLVSAAAGSGKTAVLAERCAYLVCDAPEPCDVDDLLVLTFTRAAAAEMRERIDGVIRRRADAPDADPRILMQLRLLDRAQITTLDGFCGSLVRTHFHLVGVDPTFAMLAPEDANLMRNDVAQSLIDAEYDGSDAASFKLLLEGYFASDEAALRRQVIAAHSLLQSVVDPDAWMKGAVARLNDAAASTDAGLFADYAHVQQRELSSAIRRLEQVAARADHSEGLANYGAHAQAIAVDLREWLELSRLRRFDVLAEQSKGYKAPRLPTVKKDVPGKARMQAEINDVKDRLKAKGKIRAACLFSGAQLMADLGRIAPLADYFFGLVRRFATGYDRAKRDLRSLDFADTETLALRILRAAGEGLVPSAAAYELQRRFRHVLVDEYQDINPLQNAILRLVSRDRAAELAPATTRSNFFTVGDVKQSIYSFRLAEPQQFIEREAMLREPGAALGEVVDLQENFRSRAPLLGAINDVFRLLMTAESTGIDYDATQELRSLNDYPAIEGPHFAGKPIELHLLPREIAHGADDESGDDDDDQPDSFDREIAVVARRIRELVCADESKRMRVMQKSADGLRARPVRYGDIAVLLRTRRVKSSQMADALRSHGIPVHSDDATGFFAATEVQDVLSVLRVLSNGRQDIPLAAHIRSPLSPVTAKDDALALIRIAYPDELYHRAVTRYATERSDTLAEQLKAMLDTLAGWRRMFQERPVGESLLRLYEHNGFLTFCRALPDGAQRVANLGELLARGETFDAFERQGLDRFLAFLEELAVDDQLGRPSLGEGSTDVVQIMTVHRSKGLEFPVVIVPDLGKRFNERSLSDPVLLDRDRGIGMTAVDLRRRIRYPSAASLVVRDHARRRALAEEIRVLYVALTRAREHLILIGSTKQSDVLATWREGWSDHEGPLPDEAIQDASTALDWLGPIVAMVEARGLGTFAVTDRTSQPDPSAIPADARRGDSEVPTEPCAPDDGPLPPPLSELTDADAQRAVARLTYQYPHAAAARQRATIRVTDFVDEALQRDIVRTTSLPWPAIFRPSERPKAVDIGTATHRLLQFLNVRDAATPAAVELQIDALVARRLMTAAEAKLVDLGSIVWFAASSVGAAMRQPGARMLREQTLALNVAAMAGGTADDLTLLRGRVDAMIVAPAGLTLIDYKSERVEPDEVGTRAARYMPQIAGYADAMADITGRPILQAALVFLRPRVIVDVPLTGRPR